MVIKAHAQPPFESRTLHTHPRVIINLRDRAAPRLATVGKKMGYRQNEATPRHTVLPYLIFLAIIQPQNKKWLKTDSEMFCTLTEAKE